MMGLEAKPKTAPAHTAGPWTAARTELKLFCRETGQPKPEVRHAVSGKHGQCVCAFSEQYVENAEANARLIAAAPEMLDALENILGAWNERECNCDVVDGDDGVPHGRACFYHRIEQEMKSAIAKATGSTRE